MSGLTWAELIWLLLFVGTVAYFTGHILGHMQEARGRGADLKATEASDE